MECAGRAVVAKYGRERCWRRKATQGARSRAAEPEAVTLPNQLEEKKKEKKKKTRKKKKNSKPSQQIVDEARGDSSRSMEVDGSNYCNFVTIENQN
jgi:hypothetical protein